MARRYTRDNRGRFATTGATARGAGLRTAAGNKRVSVKVEAPAAKRAGAVSAKPKPVKPKPQSKLRPGELISANARPVGTVSKFKPSRNTGLSDAPNMRDKNLDVYTRIAKKDLKRAGIDADVRLKDAMYNAWAIGYYTPRIQNGPFDIKPSVSFAPGSGHFEQPRAATLKLRKEGFLGTSDPRHVAFHEVGHAVHNKKLGYVDTSSANLAGGRGSVAGRVSQYAKTNRGEFVAEVYAGLRLGRKYDKEVMSQYREFMGLPEKPSARRRSRLRKP